MVQPATYQLEVRRPAVALQPVADPAAWTRDNFRAAPPWVVTLADDEIAEIVAATARLAAADIPLTKIAREHFPLERAGRVMENVHRELVDGVGVVQLRGLPVARLSRREAAVAFLGLGTWLGTRASQNAAGHVLGHVKDLGFDYDDPKARGYQTAATMGFHTDPCDFVALMCLRTARAGGESRVVSSVALYNEMLARRPDLVALLTQDFYWTRHGEIPPGEAPWYRMPVFSFEGGWFSARGISSHILKAQALPGVPPFTEGQNEAIALFRALTQELAVDVPFQEGDFQVLCNHVMLHSRRPFEDWEAQSEKRHLLRLWLLDPGCRPVPALVREGFKGIEIAGFTPKAPLEAEADAA